MFDIYMVYNDKTYKNDYEVKLRFGIELHLMRGNK